MLATAAVAQGPYPGNVLITPVRSTETFLIDNDFNILHSWHGTNGAGHTVYLLPDFSVLRSQGDPNGQLGGGGGSGGHLQRIDENDNVVWDYFISNATQQGHHDIQPMPNGNVLAILWEVRTEAEAIAAGRTASITGDLLTTLILELEPVGSNDANIVWEWRIWDHLIQDTDPAKPNHGVIADHPERIDVNTGNTGGSWAHANFIDYDPENDLIVFSARRMEEFYIIDHSTTTAEAAGSSGGNHGKGGDILYRWGNPANYGRGTTTDQVFFGVHGANFIDEGLPGAHGVLAFNNGNRDGDADDRSSVVEIQPPRDGSGHFTIDPGQPYGPASPDWEYEAGISFYSLRYGSAFRQPNGNTLICEGVDGLVFEVTPAGDRVWSYLEPIGNGVFSAERYFDSTVPVFISAFDARATEAGVALDWRIEADEAIDGFTLVRANNETQREEPVHDGLLPASTRSFLDAEVDPGTEYRYALIVKSADGGVVRSPQVSVRLTASANVLYQNAPNPFNPTTTIRYDLGAPGHVTLRIYNVAGQVVRTLVNEAQSASASSFEVVWDGRNDAGVSVASGTYFYRLTAGGQFVSTKKLQLAK